MESYVCIHGHFYQPPRENPWLEAIELQDSAYPYHDWNQRINAESYAPNSRSRILAGDGRIKSIVNNYSRISFDFGPTLLSWMEENARDTYDAILRADRDGQALFGGHGPAIAQAYNHMIMPMANRRDKHTQILWGIRDFEHRFGRFPEGMWLPETAVDLETLDIMAEAGLRFTILAPHQAARVRRIGGDTWQDVAGARVDPTMAYTLTLPSSRSIVVFFYDGPISRAVAFEGLLSSGDQLVTRLASGFSERRAWPQIVHIATDGETYGHHHRLGDMALAYALDHIEQKTAARLTIYGEFLEKHPPTHEVEIIENTSWSCAHGIERWRGDCGCNLGMRPGWNQAWRKPLREAFDWARDKLNPAFEQKAAELLKDPWAARDDYVSVILDRSVPVIDGFLARNAARPLAEHEITEVLNILELQRHLMLMYTSCGWFFDDISGIETVQVLQYAGRAIQVAEDTLGDETETGLLQLLAKVKSNIPENRDGALIYERFVQPSRVGLHEVCAHYAVSSLFEPYDPKARVYCYDIEREDHQTFEAGRARLVVGRARVSSAITQESEDLSFAVLHFGDHLLNGGVQEFHGMRPYLAMVRDVSEAFHRADLPEAIRMLDRHFQELDYSLKSLFRDVQRRTVRRILEPALAETESLYRGIYERYAPMMRFVSDLGVPLPNRLERATELIINLDLRRAFEGGAPNLGEVETRLAEAKLLRIPLDQASLSFVIEQTIDHRAEGFRKSPDDVDTLGLFDRLIGLSESLPFEVSYWTAQNVYHDVLQSTYPAVRQRGLAGDATAQKWVALFQSLGKKLSMLVE